MGLGHDIISTALTGLLCYSVWAYLGNAKDFEHNVYLGRISKSILGYFFYRGNNFSIICVVGQVVNLILITLNIALIIIRGGYAYPPELFLSLEALNFIVIGIVAGFDNKGRKKYIKQILKCS